MPSSVVLCVHLCSGGKIGLFDAFSWNVSFQVSASPSVAPESDRKQYLAAQLFKGVTDTPQSSPGAKSLSNRMTNRLSREVRKPKQNTTDRRIPSVPEKFSFAKEKIAKNAVKTNMDLLLDISGTSNIDNSENSDSLLSSTATEAEQSRTLRDDRVTENLPLLTENETSLNLFSGDLHIHDSSIIQVCLFCFSFSSLVTFNGVFSTINTATSTLKITETLC